MGLSGPQFPPQLYHKGVAAPKTLLIPGPVWLPLSGDLLKCQLPFPMPVLTSLWVSDPLAVWAGGAGGFLRNPRLSPPRPESH